MEGLVLFGGFILLLVVPVIIVVWINQKQSLGTIRCSCHYTGPPGGQWKPFQGIRPACPKCGSEDWVRVETNQS